MLEEDVEFVGYFFKRWAYASRGGTRTVPLVLAKAPHWQSRAIADRQTVGHGDGLPKLGIIVVLIGGTSAVALLIAILVYYRSSSSSPSAAWLAERSSRNALASIDSFQLKPTTEESLRQLSQSDRENTP